MASRQKPPRGLQAEVLERYGHACGYCGVPFGSVIRYRGRVMATTVHWDHAVPYAYLLANPDINWVASCGQCNHAKSDLLFTDAHDLRSYVHAQLVRRGWEVLWWAPVASTADPHQWAVKFATFLARRDDLGGVEFTMPRARSRRTSDLRGGVS